MTEGLGRERKRISEEEKKRIVEQMREGYQKMASLNRKLAEEYFIEQKGEANK
ncbi:MAG: hypothetical protein ACOCZT_02150 [Halanaerobiales bacterium]